MRVYDRDGAVGVIREDAKLLYAVAPDTTAAAIKQLRTELNACKEQHADEVGVLRTELEQTQIALENLDEAADFAYGALRDATEDLLDKPAGYAVIRMIQDARKKAKLIRARRMINDVDE